MSEMINQFRADASEKARRRRRGSLVMVVLALLLAALMAALWWATVRIDRLEAVSSERGVLNASQDDSIKALSADSAKLRAELQKRGVNPDRIAPPPSERVKEIVVVPGEPGKDASPEMIRAAVQEEISRNGVRLNSAQLAQVSAAVQSRTPTIGDVQVLVRRAVADIPRPKNGTNGKPGAPGTPGPSGTDGKAGEPGPGPTQEQVDAAVSKFCADGACRGADGRGIVSLTINESGHLVAKYTTGDTEDLGNVVGPEGPPGPDCPDGYTGQERVIVVAGPPGNLTQTAFVCAKDQ